MADKAHRQTDKHIDAMEKHLSEIYERANKEIEEKADTYSASLKKRIKNSLKS